MEAQLNQPLENMVMAYKEQVVFDCYGNEYMKVSEYAGTKGKAHLKEIYYELPSMGWKHAFGRYERRKW